MGRALAFRPVYTDKALRNRLLTWGTTHEGEGRGAYLRCSYQRLPQEREELKKTGPVTSACIPFSGEQTCF